MLFRNRRCNFLFQNLSLKIVNNTLLLLLASHAMFGQALQPSLSAPYTGIGVYSKNFTDAFSGMVNQAALAQATAAAAGVYGERRFMLKELSNYTVAVVLPSKLGGFGLTARYFGSEHFNHAQFGIGFGKKLGSKIDFGIQFNYNSIKQAGYGSSSVINVEAGTILHLTEKLQMGIHVCNPAGGKFGKSNSEKLASVYTAVFGYEVSDKLLIGAEISKQEDQPVNMIPVMQYDFAKQFFARLGIATGTGNYFCGLGVQWKICRVDIITNWHTQLGFTPAIMLLFNLHEPVQQKKD